MFEHLRKEGYIRVRVDGEMKLLEDVESLEKNKKHNIDVWVDRIVKGSDRSRLHDSLETALKLSDGLAVVTYNEEEILFPAIIPVNTAASTFRSWSRGCFPSMHRLVPVTTARDLASRRRWMWII